MAGWSLGGEQLALAATTTLKKDDGVAWVYATTGASDRVLNLPAAADCPGRIIFAKKIDTGAGKFTITPNGSETIDGFATYGLWYQGNFVVIQAVGSGWQRIGGTAKVLIPEVLRANKVSSFATIGTAWNGVDCSANAPPGAKDVRVVARLGFAGDGTTDAVLLHLRKNGSSSTTVPAALRVRAYHTDLGAGLIITTQDVHEVEVDSSRIFEHSDLVRRGGGAGTGSLDIDIVGYSYE